VGEVSPPVVSPTGVHLLKLDGVVAGGSVPLDEVKDQIRQMLAGRALDERFRAWIDKNVRSKHHVEVLN
jgi:parvulin-like peptidyl-prolyl isomerase